MVTEELRELRHQYKAAYTEYMRCVHTLSWRAAMSERLSSEEIRAEEKAFHELSLARRALVDALREPAAQTSD